MEFLERETENGVLLDLKKMLTFKISRMPVSVKEIQKGSSFWVSPCIGEWHSSVNRGQRGYLSHHNLD